MSQSWQYLAPLLRGAGLTLVLCLVSGTIGSAIGLVLGLAKVSHNVVARGLSTIYVNLIRGLPVLIILFSMYYVLPLFASSFTFSRAFTAIVALSVYAGAYIAEIVRGSIEAVPKGQTEAANALGMNYIVRFRYVIVPQAMRIIVPPAAGFLISLVKASSLVSVIGYVELTRSARIISTQNQNPLATFAVAAVAYFIICYPISRLARRYERRASVQFQGVSL
jgi:polar amino acid transport system permease protein